MKKLLLFSLATMLFLTSFTVINYNWIEFNPEAGNCIISFPGEPATKEKIINTEFGELKMKISSLAPANGTDDNKVYSLTYQDFPTGTIHSDSTSTLKSFFDNSRDGAVANVQGKLLSETIITINGFPGREQRIDFKNGLAIIKCRTYLVKNRVFILQVITLTENSFNLSINKFLDSFKLIQ